LSKWHRIPSGRALTAAEKAHVVRAIARWLRAQNVNFARAASARGGRAAPVHVGGNRSE
jgi:hypothetical protein